MIQLDPDLQAAVDFAAAMEPFRIDDYRLKRAFEQPQFTRRNDLEHAPLCCLFQYLDCRHYVQGDCLQLMARDGSLQEAADCGCPSQIKTLAANYGVTFPFGVPDEVRLDFLTWVAQNTAILPFNGCCGHLLTPKHAPAYAEAQQRFRNICREYGEPRAQNPDRVPG